MSKRRLSVLLICAGVVAVTVTLGATVFVTDIFDYLRDGLCAGPVAPAKPEEKVIYVACGDAPAQMPTL